MGNALQTSRGGQGYAFRLRLGDGHEWRLTAGSGMESWLKQMAAVMQLRKDRSASDSCIIFVRGEAEDHASCPPLMAPLRGGMRDLPESGWEPRLLHLVRFWTHPDVPALLCEVAPEEAPKYRFVQMREFLYWIYHRTMDRGGIPFHAGLVARNGTACILSGPSEAGKSTCCNRIPSPWHALSDDEALVVRDQKGRYVVHSFPTWSDYVNRCETRKTWNVEMALPLGAVFFLKQGEADEVIPLNRSNTAISITALSWPQVLPPFAAWPAETMAGLRRRLFENAWELARSVPSYLLRVSLPGRFWEKLEGVLGFDCDLGEVKADGRIQ